MREKLRIGLIPLADAAALLIAIDRGFAADGNIKVSRDGAHRTDPRYLLVGGAAARPDSGHAAWLYAQMVRWGQAPLSRDMLGAATAVWRPDLYDAAIGEPAALLPFDAENIEAHLAAWTIKRVARN